MLFLDNSYLREFEAKIININENKIILDKTAFYAKSGGQPGDQGSFFINNDLINIIDTTYDENKNIIHICDEKINIEKNIKIKAKIDWTRRYKFMRMHSALHLLCSLIPYEVTGGQISFDKSRLDFNDQDKKIEKENIENDINNLVKENHQISCEWISSEELDKKPELVRTMSVKPPRTNNKIRLVKIGNVDLQPCGGTHVNSTKEIGSISIGKIENKGRMNRRVNLLIND